MSVARHQGRICVWLAVGFAALHAAAEPVIVSLGALPDGEHSRGYAMNSDGTAVVGEADSSVGWHAFLWTPAEGMRDLGVLTGGLDSVAFGVSEDGKVVVGDSQTAEGQFGFVWTPDEGMRELAAPPGWRAGKASSVSSDGRVIAGAMRSDGGQWVAARWVDGGVGEALDMPPGAGQSIAYGISGDGGLLTGRVTLGESRPMFIWSELDGMRDLGVPEGAAYAAGSAISDDHSTVVGVANTDAGFRATRWREDTGWEIIHGPWESPLWSFATGVTATGVAMVGGTWSLNFGTYPFYWRDDIGPVRLAEQGALGIDLRGWTLRGGSAISPDGTILLAYGSHGGAVVACLITGLPRVDSLCMPDFTGDGVLDVFDVQEFLDRFAAGSADADFVRDGVLDFFDLQAFLNAFAEGCG